MINYHDVQQVLPGLEPEQIAQISEQADDTASQVTASYLASTPPAPSYLQEVQRQTRAASLGREVAWAQIGEEIEARTPDWVREFWMSQDLPPKIASIFHNDDRWEAMTTSGRFYPDEWMVWDWGEDPEYTEEIKTRMIDWIETQILPHLHEHMITQHLGPFWELFSAVTNSDDAPEKFHWQTGYWPLEPLLNVLMNHDADQVIPSVWSQEPSLLERETFEWMLWSVAIQMRWEVEENPNRQMFPWASEILELKGSGPDTFDELLHVIPTDLVIVG